MVIMKRLYEEILSLHFKENNIMAFVTGARQVGKTTTCRGFQSNIKYFSWDNLNHRQSILLGPENVAELLGKDKLSDKKEIVLFDEIHKYSKWKIFIKGLFDTYKEKFDIIVTGSSRLDIFKKGGDSLMGRYFIYHIHPLSLSEILNPILSENEIRKPVVKQDTDVLDKLFEHGGFPEPYLKADSRFSIRWNKLRKEQLFREDLRDISRIQEIGQMEVLAELIKSQAGQLTNYSNLARKINVSVDTVRRWLVTLQAVHYCYLIRPWSKNITRSLLKEPKIYLIDWALVDDQGARYENMLASHLLKAVSFWNDMGMGNFGLYYLRDKSGRETDFLITKNNIPWFLAEAKYSINKPLSESLFYYQKQTKARHAFQIAFDADIVNKDCFSVYDPVKVPARTFLSQLI